MISFDEVGIILDDIAAELPEDFYRDLNGGIILSPEIKTHSESNEPNYLYILGEYHNEQRGLGRYIIIYYGSFIKLYPYLQPDQQRERLRKVLLHEFTHHLESLAGERGLEIKDRIDLEKYKKRFKRE